MARRSRIVASLEGKLGVVIRREVLKALRLLKLQIAKRERELAALKAEYAQGAEFLKGRLKAGSAPTRRRPRRRARQINWKQVFASLPGHFTLETLTRHPVAGKRPKAHLYAIVSRWKKEKLLTADPSGGYRKAGTQPKPRPAPRPKAARPPKPTPRPEAPSA